MFVRFARRTLAPLAAAAFIAGIAAAPAWSADPVSAVRLFGSSEVVNVDIAPFPKWTGVLQRYAQEQRLEDEACRGAHCELQNWSKFVAGLAGRDRMAQLRAVNAYANRVTYRTDQENYGVEDYWATPREFFTRGGDCEDYAIAKYFSLRKLGWSASDLRVVVLQHELRNELHAVLVAYVDGTAYVLDNLDPEVREHASIRYFRPIFSINETSWFLHRDWNPNSVAPVARVAPREVAPVARVISVPAAAPAQVAQRLAPLMPASESR